MFNVFLFDKYIMVNKKTIKRYKRSKRNKMNKRSRKGGFFGRFFKKEEEELNPYTGVTSIKGINGTTSTLEELYKEQCKKHFGFIKNKTTKCKNMEKAIKMNIEKASALALSREINNKDYDKMKESDDEKKKKNNNPLSKEEEGYFVLDVNMSNLNDDDKNKVIRMYPLLVFDYTKEELDTNPDAVKAKVIQFFKQFIANNDPEEYEYTKEELINNPNQVIQKVKDIDDHKNRAYYVSEKMTEDEDEDEPEEIDYRKWRDVGFDDDLKPEQNYSSKPMDNNYDLRPDMSLTSRARGGKRRTKKHLQKRSISKQSMKKRSIRKSRKQKKR